MDESDIYDESEVDENVGEYEFYMNPDEIERMEESGMRADWSAGCNTTVNPEMMQLLLRPLPEGCHKNIALSKSGRQRDLPSAFHRLFKIVAYNDAYYGETYDMPRSPKPEA